MFFPTETMMRVIIMICLGLTALRSCYSSGTDGPGTNHEEGQHHRQKRLLWITNDGRIALPPGTIMTITPTLALPFVRYPPYGFLSNMTISLPFTSEYISTYRKMSALLQVFIRNAIFHPEITHAYKNSRNNFTQCVTFNPCPIPSLVKVSD